MHLLNGFMNVKELISCFYDSFIFLLLVFKLINSEKMNVQLINVKLGQSVCACDLIFVLSFVYLFQTHVILRIVFFCLTVNILHSLAST